MSNRSVITIGNFDGVHRGHQQLLLRAKQWASENGGNVIVMSFDPHPMSILKPELAPRRLSTVARREQILKELGADQVVFLEPKKDLLQLEPEDFVRQVVEQYQPAVLVEGNDFRFGRQRRGDIKLLAEIGGKSGFQIDIVPTCDVVLSNHHIVRVSSSLVRWLIEKGRVADAEIAIGRPYTFESIVVTGEKVGRQLGFPTSILI
ncbi:adenylyltransferase/cytidyltransferase family protein [Planctomycetota bacterium]|nr:adenylyltransferase/cytidyltransferase family protein [Planctomycetota bacterium]